MKPHPAQRAPPEHGLDQAPAGCGLDESVCAQTRPHEIHTARSRHCIGANDRNAVKEKANILCTIPEEEKAGATFLPNPLGGHVAALGLGKLALLAAWAA